MKKSIKIILLSLLLTNISNADDGDIVGRDGQGKNIFGHVGFVKDGVVYEMLNLTHKITNFTQYDYVVHDYKSSLFKNTLSSFESYDGFWGQKYNSYVEDNYKNRIYNYMNPWVNYTYKYGAKYNVYDTSSSPKNYSWSKVTDPNGKYTYIWKLVLPSYRCDSFFKSMYAAGGLRINKTALPKSLFSAFNKTR